jgi:oligoendopeptidase F
MNLLRQQAKKNRKFLPPDLEIRSFQDIEKYIQELLNIPINTTDELTTWLLKRSEFDSVIEEDKAWLYIHQSCHTGNKEYAEAFARFVRNIDQRYATVSHQLNVKINNFCSHNRYPAEFEVFVRNIRRQIELYNEANTILQSELEVEEQQYGSITGNMTIHYQRKDHTLQQAQNF